MPFSPQQGPSLCRRRAPVKRDRSFVKALLLSVALTLAGAQSVAMPTVPPELPQVVPVVTLSEVLEPLADLIGMAESDRVGGYNAANTGTPMDLGTNGFVRYFGQPSSEVTVRNIVSAHSWGNLHAVGRYQIIGTTLRGLVEDGCIHLDEFFTPEVQDRAFACLLQKKRPDVWAYLRGGVDAEAAMDSLAMEFASMPQWDGTSYYGGNDRAHATRSQVFDALIATRQRAFAYPDLLA